MRIQVGGGHTNKYSETRTRVYRRLLWGRGNRRGECIVTTVMGGHRGIYLPSNGPMFTHCWAVTQTLVLISLCSSEQILAYTHEVSRKQKATARARSTYRAVFLWYSNPTARMSEPKAHCVQGHLAFLTKNEWFGNVPKNLLVIKSFWNKAEGNRKLLRFQKWYRCLYRAPLSIKSKWMRGFESPIKLKKL